ncbi:MAG: DUF5666 domain-containing protein [Candidatus Eremiobacteraeota bacterium]|nr:DUF5666 domain-containing protein [Candidatus Eremiobacteraeota bacterium]
MLHHRIAVAALAALFGTAVTGSAIVAGATHPTAAYADDDERGDHGDRHDNGKHKGWKKHHHNDEHDQGDRGNGSTLRGTIVGINGATLGVRLNDGRTITVNDQNALNAGNVPNLYVGETIYLRGGYGQDGVYYANRISVAGNNNGGNNNGGYGNGGYNNGGNCNVNTSGAVTVAGYERGGFNGSSFTLRQPFINGVPIGTDYTIIVNGGTCVQRALGSNGEHVTVVGVPLNDGHTIQAIRITG